METKSLLYGLIGFFIGGLLVSVAATTFDKPEAEPAQHTTNSMTMDDMSAMLIGKTGDDYDKAFIEGMIEHHEGAVAMAQQSEANAKHDEIKALSKAIISAQQDEIAKMQQWQKDWGYTAGSADGHGSH